MAESPDFGAGGSEESDLGSGCIDLSAVPVVSCLIEIGDIRPLAGVKVNVGSNRAVHCARRYDMVNGLGRRASIHNRF